MRETPGPFETARTALVTLTAGRWLGSSERSWRSLPVPSGPPSVRLNGPDPDRILLLGSGIAMGYGATSHEAALAGRIAHHVSALTGRGVQIDVLAGENLGPGEVLRHLTVRRMRELDVVVATPGSLEQMLLMPVSVWREDIRAQLDHFAANAPASLRVVFVGVPEISRIMPVPRLLGFVADRCARALNRELVRLCAQRDNVEFVPFLPTERAGRDGTGRTYQSWAGLIAPAVASALGGQQAMAG